MYLESSIITCRCPFPCLHGRFSKVIISIFVVLNLIVLLSLCITSDKGFIGILPTSIIKFNFFFGSRLPFKGNNTVKYQSEYLQNEDYDPALDQRIQTILKTAPHAYLMTLNKLLYNETYANKTLLEYALKSGAGLKNFKTEKYEDISIENGVQYRVFPYLEPVDNPAYDSEFEAYVPFNRTLFFEGDETNLSVDTTKKKIILWWQHKNDHGPVNGLNPLKACPDFPCVVTSERKYTENSSAIMINAQWVREKPPNRRQDQVIVFYQNESPRGYWVNGPLLENSKEWNEAFNWTMTYRLESDIPIYYGIVRRRRAVASKNYTDILRKKTGLVVWMVSHCDVYSRRSQYVNELKKYIPVDIYGGCGSFQCPRNQDKQCLIQLKTKYKFYLSFENDFCKEYITEKLYKYLDSDMIIVARGHNSYSNNLPSDIFINTANYKSPKELAEKLLYLNSHAEEYIQMLKEKSKYAAIYEDYPLPGTPGNTPFYIEHRYEAVPFCLLCQRVWNLNKYAKRIPSMSEWYNKPEYQCHPPTDLPS